MDNMSGVSGDDEEHVGSKEEIILATKEIKKVYFYLIYWFD